MKARVNARITISARREEVFEYLTNLKYHFLWTPHLQSLSPQDVVRLGSAYESASLLLGVRVKGRNLVTKFLPGRELELKNQTGTIQYFVNYQLRSKHKKTVILCTTCVSPNGEAFAFTATVLKILARRELKTDLRALKTAVEQRKVNFN